MDKFGDMDLFVRVVKAGGLAAAGREIGLSPASVSARINGMEKRYDIRLLNRTTRSVSVTEEGQSFYDASIGILADLAEAENQLVTSRGQLAGPLRITAPSDLGQQHIAPVLSRLVKQHREIVPHLHLSDGVVSLAEHNVDVAIRYGEPADSTLIAKHLSTNFRVLCASKAYIKKNGAPKSPDDLMNHECLAMVRQMEPLTSWYFSKGGTEQVVQIRPTRSTNDGALVRQWAIDGLGIALKSVLDIAEDLQSKRLVRVLKTYTPDFKRDVASQRADLFAVYPTRQYVPKRVRVFLELLEDHFKTMNDTY